MKIKTFSTDFLYTCGSQIVVNAVQHLFVFPWINKVSGPEVAGRILACLSIVYIFSTSFGLGMSSIRLVEDRKKCGTNGDYLVIIGIGFLVVSAIAVIAKHYNFDPGINLIWFILLSFLTLVKSYGLVEFRLKLHFAQYFFYNLMVAIGYSLGVLIYRQTGNWTHIFLLGEIFAILILIFRKFIFQLSKPSDKLGYLVKAVILLFLSTVMIQLVVSGDRLILKYFLGDRSVTVYSSLSLPVKIVNMVVFPLGTLLLTYLTARTIPVNKNWFFKVFTIWTTVSTLAIIGTIIIAPIYVKLFYSNIYNDIKDLNLIVNFGLGLALIGYLFRIYLIVSSNSTIVFYFELAFTIIHLLLSITLTKQFGMVGYAWAVIISRAARAFVGFFLTLFFVSKVERLSLENGGNAISTQGA